MLSLLGLTEHELEAPHARVGNGLQQLRRLRLQGPHRHLRGAAHHRRAARVLLDNPTESALSAVAQAEGVATLRMSALAAARRGITTYEEVLRVTHIDAVDPSSDNHCHTCTRQVKADMAFCPWCRAALKRPSCSSCGNRLEPRWQGCATCGAEIVDGDTKPTLAEVLPKTPPFVLPEAPSAPPSAPPSSFLQAGSAAPVAKAEPARPAAFAMPDSFVMPGAPRPEPTRAAPSTLAPAAQALTRPVCSGTGTARPAQRTRATAYSPAHPRPRPPWPTSSPGRLSWPVHRRRRGPPPRPAQAQAPSAAALAEALSGLIRPASPTASATPTQDAPEQPATYTPPASPGGAPGFSTPNVALNEFAAFTEVAAYGKRARPWV